MPGSVVLPVPLSIVPAATDALGSEMTESPSSSTLPMPEVRYTRLVVLCLLMYG
jgi:hypothetical protein